MGRLLAAALIAGGLVGGVPPSARGETPELNYMLHCQGCHRADGEGKPGSVPALADSVARFALLPEGRAYLMRVPGASQSPLSDADLAAVLNYMVQRFGPADAAAKAAPFTAAEVRASRHPALLEVQSVRARLVKKLGESATPGYP